MFYLKSTDVFIVEVRCFCFPERFFILALSFMSSSEGIDIMSTPKKDIMVVLCSATANAPQRLNSGTKYSPPTFEYPQIVLPEGHDFTIFSGEKRAFRAVRRTAKG